MTTNPLDNDPFIDQIMRSIVNQFFAAPYVVPPPNEPYLQQRSTPTQVVAERMLVAKQEQLLVTIMDKLDVDVVAQTIAEKLAFKLMEKDSGSTWNKSDGVLMRERLQEQIDKRFVELVAQKAFNDMQANRAGDGDGEIGAGVGTL